MVDVVEAMQRRGHGIIVIVKATGATGTFEVDAIAKMRVACSDSERFFIERAKETESVEIADTALQMARAGGEVVGHRERGSPGDRCTHTLLAEPLEQDVAADGD